MKIKNLWNVLSVTAMVLALNASITSCSDEEDKTPTKSYSFIGKWRSSGTISGEDATLVMKLRTGGKGYQVGLSTSHKATQGEFYYTYWLDIYDSKNATFDVRNNTTGNTFLDGSHTAILSENTLRLQKDGREVIMTRMKDDSLDDLINKEWKETFSDGSYYIRKFNKNGTGIERVSGMNEVSFTYSYDADAGTMDIVYDETGNGAHYFSVMLIDNKLVQFWKSGSKVYRDVLSY